MDLGTSSVPLDAIPFDVYKVKPVYNDQGRSNLKFCYGRAKNLRPN